MDFRNWFEINNTCKAMLYLRYRSGYDDGFTRNKHSFSVNLRLQKDFLQKSLTVSLYANDIFKQQRDRWTGYYSVATMTKDSYGYTRVIGISVSYNFNNTGKGSTQADAKRLKYNNMKQQLLTSSKSNATYKKYGLYENIELTELEYYELEGKTDNLKGIIDKISLEKSMGEEFNLNDYELILKHVKK